MNFSIGGLTFHGGAMRLPVNIENTIIFSLTSCEMAAPCAGV